MPLCSSAEQLPRRVERRVVADADQDIVQLLVFPAGVADAVCGDERQAHPHGEVRQGLVAMLLTGQPMPPDLDMEPPRKDRREPAERLASRRDPSPRERPRDRSLLAARQAMEPLRVRRDIVERDARFALGPARRPRGDQPAEVLVAGPALDEQGEPRKLLTGERGDWGTG